MIHGTRFSLIFVIGVILTFPNSAPVSPLPNAASTGVHAGKLTDRLTQGRNAINGTVSDSSRRPLNRIRIELLDEVEMIIATTYTNVAGRYSFNNLTQGNFQVRTQTPGTFVDQTVRVQLYYAGGTGAHFEQVDFTLKTPIEAKATSNPISTNIAFVQPVPPEAQKVYDEASNLLDTGKDVDAGIEKLLFAIRLFPDYYLALERLGAEYVKRNQLDLAQKTLKKAIEVNSKGATSYYALGVSQVKLRQYPEAAESLKNSIAYSPNSPNVPFSNYYLGVALVRSGKTEDAESAFKAASEKGGKTIPADVHMHLAQIYSNTKRYKEAADELEIFLKETPNARDAESIKNVIKQLRAKADK